MLQKGQLPILIVNSVLLVIFTLLFLSRENYEFIIYVFVILLFMVLVLLTNKKVKYPNGILWGLSIWAFLHMAGGGVYLDGKKLYELMLLPLVGEPYNIIKFDQFVHALGFYVTTLVMFHIIKDQLKPKHRWGALSIVIVMAGLGAGALNEIIEFSATVLVPETGVGGYENTSLDLISNMVGALLAMVWIYHKEKKT